MTSYNVKFQATNKSMIFVHYYHLLVVVVVGAAVYVSGAVIGKTPSWSLNLLYIYCHASVCIVILS